MIRRFAREARGAAAVEFALVAPLLIGTVMSVMEAGRVVWTRQVVQQTASASARCAGLKGTGCTDASTVRTYAIARARLSGIKLTNAMVTPTWTATSCAGQSNMRQVSISMVYTGISAPLLRRMNFKLNATACYPIITT